MKDSLVYAIVNSGDTLVSADYHQPVYRPSIFTDHMLPVSSDSFGVLEADSSGIAYWIVGISLLFLSIMHLSFRKRIALSVSAFFFHRKLEQLNEDGYLLMHPVQYAYSLFFIFLLSVFVEHFIPSVATQQIVVNYGIYALIFLGWLIFKATLYLLSGHLYASPQMGRLLMAHYQTLLVTASYITLPLVLSFLLYKNDWIAYILLVILILMFVYRFFYSFWTVRRKTDFSLYQIFLYLCTLEIAPALIALKLVIQHVITF